MGRHDIEVFAQDMWLESCKCPEVCSSSKTAISSIISSGAGLISFADVSVKLTESLIQRQDAYPGNLPDLLVNAINSLVNMKSANDELANSVAIIQSSGTGKSRMVDEAAKTVFTLPVCLRGDDDTGILKITLFPVEM